MIFRAEGAFRPLPRARARAREIEDPASGTRIRKLFRTTFAVVFEAKLQKSESYECFYTQNSLAEAYELSEKYIQVI